jgi:hypothetical protein
MSLLGQTLILYLLTGGGIALAVYLRGPAGGPLERGFRLATAIVFWPLYVPILLSRAGEGRQGPAGRPLDRDDLDTAIAEATADLEAAFAALAGWADEALAGQEKRLRRLPEVWALQAERIRAMDRLLALPEADAVVGCDGIVTPDLAGEVRAPAVTERLRRSLEVRRRNREQLRQLRSAAFADLMAALGCARELISMLHLARFTGAPPVRAEDLLGQIAALGDDLEAITWTQRASAAAGGNT